MTLLVCDMEEAAQEKEGYSCWNNSQTESYDDCCVHVVTLGSQKCCQITPNIPCNSPRSILLLFNDHKLATSWTRANSWWQVCNYFYTSTACCNKYCNTTSASLRLQ